MFKKIHSVFLILFLSITFLISCSSSGTAENNPSEENSVKVSGTAESNSPKENNAKVIGIAELDTLLNEQPLVVTKTEYVVRDEKYKSLYPDMLNAVILNNTGKDIKNVVLGFVAWDINNLPIKIKSHIDFTDGDYIKKVAFNDINLVSGGTFGEDHGYSVGEENKIDKFKVIAVSYETFEGEKWENPHYNKFKLLYEGKKYSDDMSVEVN